MRLIFLMPRLAVTDGSKFSGIDGFSGFREMEVEPARWSRVNCALCPGCILAEGHEGECDFVEEEGVYEVEDILEERSAGRGRKEYRVKWRGWPEEDCTWELAASLKGCPAILRAWKTRRRGKPPQVQKRAAPPKKASDDVLSRAKVARNSKKGDADAMKEGKAAASAATCMGGVSQVEADEAVEHTATSPCADAETAAVCSTTASASAHGEPAVCSTAVSASAHGEAAVCSTAASDAEAAACSTAVSASTHEEAAECSSAVSASAHKGAAVCSTAVSASAHEEAAECSTAVSASAHEEAAVCSTAVSASAHEEAAVCATAVSASAHEEAAVCSTAVSASAHEDAAVCSSAVSASAHEEAAVCSSAVSASAHEEAAVCSSAVSASAHAEAAVCSTAVSASAHEEAAACATAVSASAHEEAAVCSTAVSASAHEEAAVCSTAVSASAHEEAAVCSSAVSASAHGEAAMRSTAVSASAHETAVSSIPSPRGHCRPDPNAVRSVPHDERPQISPIEPSRHIEPIGPPPILAGGPFLPVLRLYSLRDRDEHISSRQQPQSSMARRADSPIHGKPHSNSAFTTSAFDWLGGTLRRGRGGRSRRSSASNAQNVNVRDGAKKGLNPRATGATSCGAAGDEASDVECDYAFVPIYQDDEDDESGSDGHVPMTIGKMDTQAYVDKGVAQVDSQINDYADESIVCCVCDDGHEQPGNLILICDGVGCDAPYHMRCLHPPLVRAPRLNSSWYCPSCKRAARLARQQRVQYSAAPASEYEKERQANIARNNFVLEQLGLVKPSKAFRSTHVDSDCA